MASYSQHPPRVLYNIVKLLRMCFPNKLLPAEAGELLKLFTESPHLPGNRDTDKHLSGNFQNYPTSFSLFDQWPGIIRLSGHHLERDEWYLISRFKRFVHNQLIISNASQLTRDLLGVPYSAEVQPASKCQFILTESPSSGRETLSFTGTLLCVRPPSALLLCPCLQLLYRDV